jgi:hypothetical protein
MYSVMRLSIHNFWSLVCQTNFFIPSIINWPWSWELLSLKVENRNTQETCREIQAAAFKINRLMFEYVGRKSVSSRTSDLIKINRAS